MREPVGALVTGILTMGLKITPQWIRIDEGWHLG